MKFAYISCISLKPLAIRSISVLIRVIADASDTAEVLNRRVLLKIMDTKLPRILMINRSIL